MKARDLLIALIARIKWCRRAAINSKSKGGWKYHIHDAEIQRCQDSIRLIIALTAESNGLADEQGTNLVAAETASALEDLVGDLTEVGV